MKKIIALALVFTVFSAPVQAKILVQQLLYQYATRGDIAGIKQLQDRGYSIDAPNHEGNTALCEAILRNNNRAANVLIRSGADRNARCMKQISNYYRNGSTSYASESPMISGTESSGTFLGMGATGWTVAGVLAAGAGIAVAAGSGGGGGSHSGGSDNSCKNVTCGENAVCSSGRCVCKSGFEGDANIGCTPEIVCVHGAKYNGACVCESGWNGETCSNPNTCTGYVVSCNAGYHPTSDTCKSGNNTMYKCEINDCSGFIDDTTCPTGYAQSDSCQTGNVIKIKCDNCAEEYQKENGVCVKITTCQNGGTLVGATCSCPDGWVGKYCQTPKACDGYEKACGNGYHQTGGTCLSGNTTMYKCEADACDGFDLTSVPAHCTSSQSCQKGSVSVFKCTACEKNWSGKDCSVYKSTGSEIIYKSMTNADLMRFNDGSYVYYIGANNKNIKGEVNSTSSVIGIDISDSIKNKPNVEAVGNAFDNKNKTASVQITQKGKGDVYGIRYKGAPRTSTQNNNDYEDDDDDDDDGIGLFNVVGFNANGEIKIVDTSGSANTENRDGFGHIYGMYADNGVGRVNNSAVLEGDNVNSKVEGTIDINSKADKHVYGIYAFGEAEAVNAESDDDGRAIGRINIKNKGNGDVYGMKSDGNMYNTDASENSTAEGYITIENEGKGDVYGMDIDSLYHDEFYNAYGEENSTAKAEIKINNIGSGNVYGINQMDVDSEYNYAENAFSWDGANVIGKIIISNQGDGDVYGIVNAGENSNIHNAFAGHGEYLEYASTNATAKGIISIDNQGNGDVYGMKSELYANNAKAWNGSNATGKVRLKNDGQGNAFGIFAEVVDSVDRYGENSPIAKSIVNVINAGKGNAYGMFGNYVHNITEGTGVTSTIEMANVDKDSSEALAVGIYGKYGSIENSGDIKIHNLGIGTAVGIYADDSAYVTNSGNIIIDREAFVDDRGTDDTSDDVTYRASTSKGGKAIGIYGASNSSINNTATGVIRINGAENAYGIYTEGGSVINDGKIYIDNVLKTDRCTGSNCLSENHAIVLNGGTLFQDGKLIVSNDLECVHGTKVNNECVCETNWSGTDCSVYKGTSSEVVYKLMTDADLIRFNDGYEVYYIGVNNKDIKGVADSINSVIGIDTSSSLMNSQVDGIINAVDNKDKTASVQITQSGKGDVYGMRLKSASGTSIQNDYDDDEEDSISLLNAFGSDTNGIIQIEDKSGNANTQNRDGFANIFGMYSDVGGVTNAELSESGTINSKVEGTIDINSRADKHVYGIYSYTDGVNAEGDENGCVIGRINIDNKGNGDVHGIKSLASVDNADASENSTAEGYITVKNEGKGNVYGININSRDANSNNHFNATAEENSTAKAEIKIDNIGNGDVYGINSDANVSVDKLYNAMARDNATATGKIIISNRGNGNVYGIKSTRDVFNTYNKSDGESKTTGIINVNNKGSGDAYGIYADWISSIWEYDSWGSPIARSVVKVINAGNGAAYGMYGREVKNTSDGGNMTSIIEMANVDENSSEALAVGIYGKDGYVNNSGDIKIHNLGDGVAVGIYADGTTSATNSGNIIIDREAFVDDRGTDDTSDDITYRASSSKGGKAIGIYGASGSYINNTSTGVIRIDGAEDAYGIYSEGGSVINDGTILIDGEYTQNAVRLNGGQLLQGGKLIVGADWSKCREGYTGAACDEFDSENYIEQNGQVYANLHCVNGMQQADTCVCYTEYSGTLCDAVAEGYIEQNGQVYAKLDCVYGTQQAYSCVCEKGATGTLCDAVEDGYIEQDGQIYAELQCVHGVQQANSCACNLGYKGDLCTERNIKTEENTYIVSQGFDSYDISFNNTEERNIVGLYLSDEQEVYRYGNGTWEFSGSINLTNHSDGDVYGIFSDVPYINNANGNDGIIRIQNEGNGNVYGMYDGYGKGITNASYSKGVISIDNTGSGNAYGMYGGYITGNADSEGDYSTKGIIRINNNGVGNAYGIYGYEGNISNGRYAASGIINVINLQSGNAYGMYNKGSVTDNYSMKPNEWNDGFDSVIKMANVGDGNAVGMYTAGGENYNSGDIVIHNLGNGTATGIYARYDASNSGNITINRANFVDDKATEDTSDDVTYAATSSSGGVAIGMRGNSLYNDGTITIDGAQNAVGMYGNKDSNVTNIGEITINGGETAIGIYGESGSEVTNSGEITINNAGTAYGIYGAKGSHINNTSTGIIRINGAEDVYGIWNEGEGVTNNGTILIDSEYTQNAVKLNGSKLFQDGVLTVSSANEPQPVSEVTEISSNKSYNKASLNLDDFGGTVVASKTSQFLVEGAISGDLAMNNNVVQDGFGTTYKVANMVVADDVSGLNLKSQSALFDASLENDTDAVMTMKSFDSVVKDDSVAEFLQNNYAIQNNEKLFSTLKSAETVASLNNNVNALFGKEMFSRMAFEDISMLREINFDMNQTLFNQEEGYFALGGNISPSNYDSNLGSIGRYSLNGYNDGKRSFAIGMSIADIRTDNGNGHNSRFDRSFVMSAPYGYRTDNGFEFITTPKLGFTNGTYRRTGLDGMNYNGNVQKRMIALMNEARYPFDFSKMTLTAALEFNAIGYNIRGGEDDKDYSLRIKSQNRASVETGFGLTASREFKPTRDSKLKLTGGVAFYHEFANPYELELGMRGMSGTYKMRNDKYGNNRTVVRFGLDYQLQDYLDVTANLLSNIDKETRTDASVDMKYNF